jgi:hypothetical protein
VSLRLKYPVLAARLVGARALSNSERLPPEQIKRRRSAERRVLNAKWDDDFTLRPGTNPVRADRDLSDTWQLDRTSTEWPNANGLVLPELIGKVPKEQFAGNYPALFNRDLLAKVEICIT